MWLAATTSPRVTKSLPRDKQEQRIVGKCYVAEPREKGRKESRSSSCCFRPGPRPGPGPVPDARRRRDGVSRLFELHNATLQAIVSGESLQVLRRRLGAVPKAKVFACDQAFDLRTTPKAIESPEHQRPAPRLTLLHSSHYLQLICCQPDKVLSAQLLNVGKGKDDFTEAGAGELGLPARSLRSQDHDRNCDDDDDDADTDSINRLTHLPLQHHSGAICRCGQRRTRCPSQSLCHAAER